MRIAHLCTAHGFGHMTRQLAIGEELAKLGCESVYFAPNPNLIHHSHPNAKVVEWSIDVGLVQLDSLKIDIEKTNVLLQQRCSEDAVNRLAEALGQFDGAVADIPPPGLEACRRAGLPVIATSNFEWAWIYSHYPQLSHWEERFREWQRPHPALFLQPGPGLVDFARIEEAPFVARSASKCSLPATSILVSFGGLGLHGLEELLPIIPGVHWILAPPCAKLKRDDVRYIEGVPYPDLIESCDMIFSKAGYSILAEAMRSGKPLILVERTSFPEAQSLENFAEGVRKDQVIRCGTKDIQQFHQALRNAVHRSMAMAPPPAMPNGAPQVAKMIAKRLA